MAWPLSQDYNEAIQSPATSLADPELRSGQPTTNALGMPQPRSGNFADVYEFECPQGRWAVKCFTREVPGLRERYAEISRHLASADLPFAVEFHYLEQGVRIRGAWYPALKMRWIEGQLLNEFVRDNLGKPARLQALSQIWTRMAKRLREANLAHADLQHGNVILVPGSTANSLAVKLIDYDGMFVPALAGRGSAEVGHANYQHPARLREGTYGPEVDRFPLLVVATALRALTVGGRELWDRYDNGDNLLFKESDLRAPTKSPLFAELLRSAVPETHALVVQLIQAVRQPLGECPLLGETPLPERAAFSRPPETPAKVAGPGLVAPVSPTPILYPPAPLPPPPSVGPALVFEHEVESQPRGDRIKRPTRSRIQLIAAGVAILGVGIGLTVWATSRVEEKPQSRIAQIENGGAPTKPESRQDPEPVAVKVDPLETPKILPPPRPKPEADPPPAEPTPPLRPNPGPDKQPAKAITNSIGMKLVRVPAGEFIMGSPSEEKARKDAEGPLREVKIAKAFYMGAYEVTQEEYTKVMGKNPSHFSSKGGGEATVKEADTRRFPVENVSYEDAVAFCEKLTAEVAEKEEKRVYRLPTEAEWEYACRAGTKTATHYGDSLSSDQANFDGDFPYRGAKKGKKLGRTCEVGSFEPNAFGLYDMHGNVWEWCSDWYAKDYYAKGEDSDPKGPIDGSTRVLRGGSWDFLGGNCRSANRHSLTPVKRDSSYGFRVVCESTLPTKSSGLCISVTKGGGVAVRREGSKRPEADDSRTTTWSVEAVAEGLDRRKDGLRATVSQLATQQRGDANLGGAGESLTRSGVSWLKCTENPPGFWALSTSRRRRPDSNGYFGGSIRFPL